MSILKQIYAALIPWGNVWPKLGSVLSFYLTFYALLKISHKSLKKNELSTQNNYGQAKSLNFRGRYLSFQSLTLCSYNATCKRVL